MAKNKKAADEKETAAGPGDFTERVCKEVVKDYGKGVLMTGTQRMESKRQVIPLSPTLDIITSGGIVEGSWVGITGNPKTGKTTLAQTFAATCQRPEFGSRPVFYGDVEGRLSETQQLQGIKGLDLDKVHIITSQEGRILTAQDHLRIYEKILRNVPRAVLIIDSISALCDEREYEGGVGTETRGSGAKLFSQFLNNNSNVVPVNKSIVLGVTHLMCNTGTMGAGFVEKATRRWHYQVNYKLRTIMTKVWKGGDKVLGLQITWKCLHSTLGPPHMQMDGYLRFGTGIDKLYEAFTFGKMAGLIGVSGAWYSLDYLMLPQHERLWMVEEKDEETGKVTTRLNRPKEAPKAQGGEGVYELLTENPEWARALEDEVVRAASGFVRYGSDD